MEILFCERCSMRISPKDLASGRCKREEMTAWCPQCTQAIASAAANPVRQEVVADPPARREPTGAVAVTGQPPRREPTGAIPLTAKVPAGSEPAPSPSSKSAVPAAERTAAPAARKSGSSARPSMIAPPTSVMQARKPTTGPTVLRRRTTPSGPEKDAAMRRAASPATGTQLRRGTPGSGRAGRQRFGAPRKPLPAGDIGKPVARRPSSADLNAVKDPTKIYFIVGLVLLVLGICMVLVVLVFGGKKGSSRPGTDRPAIELAQNSMRSNARAPRCIGM